MRLGVSVQVVSEDSTASLRAAPVSAVVGLMSVMIAGSACTAGRTPAGHSVIDVLTVTMVT